MSMYMCHVMLERIALLCLKKKWSSINKLSNNVDINLGNNVDKFARPKISSMSPEEMSVMMIFK
jgi:hypothetical protein